MSCHTDRTSPISSTEQSKELGQASGSTTPVAEKSPGLNRALQSLLITPQSKGAGGATHSPRGGTRSPVEPLVSSPLRISSSAMASAPSSPERHTAEPGAIPRRSSDQVVETGRPSTARLGNNDDDAKSNTASNSGENPHAKKRFLQARDRSQGRKGMAAMMSGRLFPRSFSRGRDSSHGSSQRGASLDSRSPPSPERGRPGSSGSHSSHVEDFKPAPASSEKGKAVNIHASLNKSDEALAKPTGDLPDYVKPSFSEQGGERLAKDVFDRDKNMIESSEDEANDTSSDDDSTLEGHRGRKKQKERNDITSITKSDFEKSTDEKAKQPEEQKETANINGSQDKKPRKSALKAVVHPQTSFDIPTPRLHSVAGTPYGSDDEAEIGDIHRAQKLSISLSDIDNGVPHRSIRTIVRGNFSSLQDQGDGSRRRRRKYLVATDLSEESVYALEWTIGTVLRDGDTIYAIYVMHEDSTTTSAVQVGEGAKAMKDARAVVGSQTKEANQSHGSRTILGRLGPGISSKTHSADSRASSMAEAERVRAVESVSQTCVKLLRKTVLQVRIAVEVIHCKNPKSMITEAIDELEPTLVIVGARGQSALKGVLLGSFSNYLLSNSSVPVMVARRRLKRHTWKEKLKGTANVRLSNNLITPKSLAQAKVD